MILSQLSADIAFQHADTCEAALEMDPGSIDMVLLDFHLPGLSGREAVLAIRHHFDGAVLVVISGEDNPATIRQAINDGAAGYIPKTSSTDVLLAALKLVLAGGSYLPPHVLDDVQPDHPAPVLEEQLVQSVRSLSGRQRAVLGKAIQGKLNKVIADELDIAEGTVKAHLSAAFKVLGARNRTEAVYIVSKLNIELTDLL